MPHIRRVHSNVKRHFEYQLEPLTFIAGPNQSGKTPILDAIRLAITGKHSVGGFAANLQSLMPAGNTELYADLELSDGAGAFSWRMPVVDGKGKKPRSPKITGIAKAWPSGQILIFDHHADLSGMGADRMRKAILDRFGENQQITAPLGLNQEQRDLWQQALAETTKAADVCKQLVMMQKWFKDHAKAKSTEAKAIFNVIEATQVDTSGALSLPKLKARQKELQAQANLQNYKDQLAKARQTLESLQAVTNDEVAAELAASQAQIKDLETRLSMISTLKTVIAAGNGTHCPVCASVEFQPQKLFAELNAIETERRQQLATQNSRVLELTAQVNTDETNQARDEVNRLESLVNGLDLSTSGAPFSQEELDRVNAEITKIDAALLTKDQLTQQEEDAHRYLGQEATAKILGGQVSKQLQRMVESVAGTAEAQVNKYLPAGMSCKLNLTDTECSWQVIGIDGCAHPIEAAAGKEQATLHVARARAWIADAPMRILMLDDRDELGLLDTQSFAKFCNHLRNAVQSNELDQVIIAWNRPHEAPADWHQILLGE